MKQYILRRVGYSLLSLFLLSLVIFLFVRVTGDPVSLLVEPGASPEDIENMRRQFGLDQPLWVQYWHFMASLAAGDLGQSFYYRTPVMDLYFQRLPNSLLLAAVAMALVAADRHPERHSGRRARRRVLGQRRQDLRVARPVAAVLLGRAGADPVLLRLSRLAAVLRFRHRRCTC